MNKLIKYLEESRSRLARKAARMAASKARIAVASYIAKKGRRSLARKAAQTKTYKRLKSKRKRRRR